MKTLIHSLLIALTFNPVFVHAEDTPTIGLQGVNAGLGAINGLVSAVGYSQMQAQQLVNQSTALMNSNSRAQTAQTAFNQTIAQLAQVMAEAETCAQGKVKDTSKFKKAKRPEILLNDPTCANYGTIIDTAKKVALDIQTVEGKYACVQDMQNKFNQIAEASKTPFQNLTQAANESYQTYTQIIELQQGVVDKLNNDLNGDNGYKKKLAELSKLSLDLQSILKGKEGATKEGGISTGLVAKANSLKRDRIKIANQWNLGILSDTNSCFYSDTSMGCDSAGTPLSPAECIARQVSTPAGNNTTKAARNAKNTAALQQVMKINMTRAQNINNLANIDIKDPNGFLAFSKDRFDKMVEEASTNIANKEFMGNDVSGSAISSYYRSKMNECYAQAVNRFKTGLESEGSQYKESLNSITDREAELYNDTKLWIETTQQQMNDFRTAFTKNYSSDLSQQTLNCTASEDPYTSIDCLKSLSATLRSGIDGTAASEKLSNNSIYTANEPVTQMNVMSMGTDASGKPIMTTTGVPCKGFKECVNVLDKTKASYEQQVQTQTQNKDKFVQSHNKNIETALGGVAATFTQSTAMITSKAKELNAMLTELGISSQIATKSVEGETLSTNENTKLYDNPKSMKAALAGKGAFTEIDAEKTNAELGEALRTRKTELNEAMKAASIKKSQCEIKKAYYENIADALGSCDATKICRGGVAPKVMGDLEDLLQRSQSNPNPEDKNAITEKYNTCVSSAKSDNKDYYSGDVSTADVLQATLSGSGTGEKAEQSNKAAQAILDRQTRNQNQMKADIAEDMAACGARAVNNLSNIARSSRGVYAENNLRVINALRTLNESCTVESIDEETNKPVYSEAATDACEAVKSSLKKATIDDTEGPSPDDKSSSSGSGLNPLRGAPAN